MFGLKILKFFEDPDPGYGIFLTLDPVSVMRHKDLGFATLIPTSRVLTGSGGQIDNANR